MPIGRPNPVRRAWRGCFLPAEIEAEWRAAAEAAYPQISGKIVPAEIFDEVRSLLEAYRADPGNAP